MKKLLLLLLFLPAFAEGQTNALVTDISKYHSNTVGFYENKEQITDQNNKPNPAVKYLLCNPGLNVQLRQTGFSYDTYIDTHDVTEEWRSETLRHGKDEAGRFDQLSPKNFTRHYHRVDIELQGCNPDAVITAEGKSAAYYNYLTAGMPEGGVSDVHYYEKVIYKNIYPDIDLEFFTSTKRKVEYNFIVHPGGNPADIKLAYKGANKVTLADDKLIVNVATGDLTENIPTSYLRDNPSMNIKISYADLGNNVFTFSLPSDIGVLNDDLVIDPTPNLAWGTYYGGNNGAVGYGVATDVSGNVYICGETSSTSGIATSGAYQTTFVGTADVFLSKFNSSGALQWATYYGGGNYDQAYSVATDTSGNVYMTGMTYSTSGIATPGAYNTTYGGGGGYTAYLAKFNSAGAIQWATYYGDADDDYGTSVAIDPSGNVYITGITSSSSGIATSGAYKTTLTGGDDAFLAKFNGSGAILWATYYGGNNVSAGSSVTTDVSGNVYISGLTYSSSGIATPGAYQTFYVGAMDAFLTKFNGSGAIQWATYYGGGNYDHGNSVATDVSGNVYMGGFTKSTSGIATTGAYQTTFVGLQDAFLSKFNSSGALQWATYYGGGTYDYGKSIATDASGNVYMGGYTQSISGIATPGAYQTTLVGTNNAFLSKFNSSGCLLWATYYGGSDNDNGYSVATDTSRDVYMAGFTNDSTSGIATSGAYQTTYGGGAYNAFIAKFDSTNTNAPPINGPSNVCIGSTIALSDATGGGAWSGSNTAVATISSSTGVVTGVSAGTVIITYSICAGIATATVTVRSLPPITGGNPMCLSSTLQLSDSTVGGVWSSDNSAVATISSTGVVSSISPGTADISYTAGPCSTGIVITVATLPAITDITNVCAGFTTPLSDASAGGVWSSGNTSVATISGTGVVYGISAGASVISYTTGGCAVTATLTVDSLPPITGDTSICVGSTTLLSDATGGGIWSSSNTLVATIGATSGLLRGGLIAGTAIITYMQGGCNQTISVSVTDTSAITGPTTVCVGGTVMLSDATAGGTWGSSNTTIATIGPTGIVTGVTPGIDVIAFSAGSCTVEVIVTVTPSSGAGTITGEAEVCTGAIFTLSDTTAAGIWSSNNTMVATINSTGNVHALSQGTAIITYTIPPNAGGCSGFATFTVIVTPLTVNGAVSQISCYGENDGSITLNSDTLQFKYAWSNGSGAPVVTGLAPGTYTVTMTEDGTPCTAVKSYSITQPDSLQITATTKNDTCDAGKGSISLNVTGGTGSYTYLWSDNKTGKEISGLLAGVYSVTVTDSNGCTRSAYTTVHGDTCNGIIIYNVLTPNGDGINDTWVIEGLSLYPDNTVQVFDKWGDMVYEKTNYNNDWNGKGKSGTLPDGTYYYLVKLNAKNLQGGQNVWTGALLLKR